MNWGKGIILVFVVFVIGIGVLVYRSMTKNIDLVTGNYYEKELKYQEQINKINNTNALKESLKIESRGKVILITYPKLETGISGDISFYKPSDAKSDFKIKVEPGSDLKQVVLSDKLNKGLWKIQVSWASGGRDYFSEEKLMLQ